MKTRSHRLQEALYELERPKPPKNLIVNYAGFLQHRDLLHYYQFSLPVLESLIQLNYDLWLSNKRISRLSLIQTTRRYAALHKKPIPYSSECRDKLFDLFRWVVIEQVTKGNKKAITAMQFSINTLLKKLILQDDQLRYLCENAARSPSVVNRLLRYPVKNPVISQWVKDNFSIDHYRTRRAEMISWLLNEDPNFVVDKEVLMADFEYVNALDQQLLADYLAERDAEYIVRRDLGGKVDGIEPVVYNRFYDPKIPDYETHIPEPIFHRRFYPAFLSFGKGHPFGTPDFARIRKDFYTYLDKSISITMLWATYYSHLSVKQKEALLIKHYIPDAYGTFFRLARQMKSINLLRWLEKSS